MPTIRNACARGYGGHKIPAFDNVSLQTETNMQNFKRICAVLIIDVQEEGRKRRLFWSGGIRKSFGEKMAWS